LFAFENGKLSDSENAIWLASLPREALAINWLSTVYRCYASAASAAADDWLRLSQTQQPN